MSIDVPGAMTAKALRGWFGVRTLFRVVAEGKPTRTDRYFDPTSTLVEDRVVLFRATDFDDAITQAETEARQYCKATRFANIYGQRVRLKFLRAVDAYSVPDERLGTGCEVYSSSAIVLDSVKDALVVTARFGKKVSRGRQDRYKFMDGRILTDALLLVKKSRAKHPPRAATRTRVPT